MKTWSQILQQLSTEFALSPQDVHSHTRAYWLHQKAKLSHPLTTMVRIPGLGRWIITPKTLFKRMAWLLMDLRKLNGGMSTPAVVTQMKPLLEAEFRDLWKLKQQQGWGLTSKKPGPKQITQPQLARYHELHQ